MSCELLFFGIFFLMEIFSHGVLFFSLNFFSHGKHVGYGIYLSQAINAMRVLFFRQNDIGTCFFCICLVTPLVYLGGRMTDLSGFVRPRLGSGVWEEFVFRRWLDYGLATQRLLLFDLFEVLSCGFCFLDRMT